MGSLILLDTFHVSVHNPYLWASRRGTPGAPAGFLTLALSGVTPPIQSSGM